MPAHAIEEFLRLVCENDSVLTQLTAMRQASKSKVEGYQAYGRVLLRVGRASDALPRLGYAAHFCNELSSTFVVFAARLDYGDALAATGDKAGACDVWREIVFRWGDAKPRSITGEAAKARMRKLGCPK